MNRFFHFFLPLPFLFFELPGQAVVAWSSPAQKRADQARTQIAKDPKHFQFYNDLAAALLERARETGDESFYKQSDEAVQKSFAIDKDNFEGQRVKAAGLLARHEFAQALEIAKALHKQRMDDLVVWGIIVDADLALGDYKDAEIGAQWMLDLRPADAGGLERGAKLRTLFGDVPGAAELWTLALRATAESESAKRAQLLSDDADAHLGAMIFDSADRLATQALSVFPNYPAALSALAKVRMAQQRYGDAVELLRKNPHLGLADQYILATALERSEHPDTAARAYSDFERQARAVTNEPANANRELVFYYADHAAKPADALRIARLEAKRRQDVYTLEALAWALHMNGDDAEASTQMNKVLAMGIRDAGVSAHAGEIAKKTKSATNAHE